MAEVGVTPDVDICTAFDLEPGYQQHLERHLKENGMARADICINLGQATDELLKMPLHNLEPLIDMICAGPPCMPGGGEDGRSQPRMVFRAKVFPQLLKWVVYCIHTCRLVAAVLENATGILHSQDGRKQIYIGSSSALTLYNVPKHIYIICLI